MRQEAVQDVRLRRKARGGGQHALHERYRPLRFLAHLSCRPRLPYGGYQEDGEETFPPGSVFDTTLPIWRMGEVLLHAESLARLLRKDEGDRITIRFRALYSGLKGRVLRSWANPLSYLVIQGGAARSDEAVLEAELPAEGIKEQLAEHLHPMTAALFERFGVTCLSQARVSTEVQRLLKSRM